MRKLRQLVSTFLVLTALLVLVPAPAFAVDLSQAYHQSVASDPTFKAAYAQWLADKESLPIGWSSLLPSFDVTGSLQRQRTDNQTPNIGGIDIEGRFLNTSKQFELLLTQPLFNYSAWYGVRNASAVVRQATATFNAAAQDLMIRTAQAYFAVLQAADDLRFTLAEKRAVYRQLDQAQQQFKVGLIAITAVHDAQSKYDSIIATEVAARNTLSNKREELREITGVLYSRMSGLTKRLPLIRPKPDNINRWISVGLKQNYGLKAETAASDAAKANIQVQGGARLPVVSATGGYSYDDETNLGGRSFAKQRSLSGGLTLDFPAFQGGGVFAKTRQARYQYQVATANWEKQYRSVVSLTRQSFLGVVSGISLIKADRQAIVSAASAVSSTEAGYQVGTRTIVDVLDAQSTLYEAQKNYARDQYQYLLDMLALKEQAGTLSVHDIQLINNWLKRPYSVDPYGRGNRVTTKTTRSTSKLRSAPKPIPKLTMKPRPIPKPMPTQAKTQLPATPVSPSPLMQAKRAILGANPNHYTIQVVAGSHKTNIEGFLETYQLQASTLIYKTTRKGGKPWYSVIYGDYSTRERATSALTQLPRNMGVNLWVRRFSSIQWELRGSN